MNKIPLTIEKSVLVDQDGINFLDALLILLENIKLLIVFPMILGLCALSATYVWPKTFESLAIIKADSSILSLITTSSVIDPVAIKLGLIENESQEEARRKLRSQIKVNLGRADQMLTLTVSASTPNQAQAIANALLQEAYIQSRPRTSEKARLEAQLKNAEMLIKDAEIASTTLLTRLEMKDSNKNINGAELGLGYAELLNIAAGARDQVLKLEAQLNGGLSDAQLIQAPTLPQQASKPKKALITIGATLAAGLLVLLFVFVRQGWRNAVKDANVFNKMALIRQALWLR